MDDRSSLYEHSKFYHIPRNVNQVHADQQGFNERVAVWITKLFSAMATFWFILLWIVLWIVVNATVVHFDPLPWPLLLALASVPQLPLMIVIMVGQRLLGRKQEIQADEQFATTIKTYHDIEEIMKHLEKQDEELLRQTAMILRISEATKKMLEPRRKAKAVSVKEVAETKEEVGEPTQPLPELPISEHTKQDYDPAWATHVK